MTHDALQVYRALLGRRPAPALVALVQQYQGMDATQLKDEIQRRGMTPPSNVRKHVLVIFLVRNDTKKGSK